MNNVFSIFILSMSAYAFFYWFEAFRRDKLNNTKIPSSASYILSLLFSLWIAPNPLEIFEILLSSKGELSVVLFAFSIAFVKGFVEFSRMLLMTKQKLALAAVIGYFFIGIIMIPLMLKPAIDTLLIIFFKPRNFEVLSQMSVEIAVVAFFVITFTYVFHLKSKNRT